jgi:energy-coupling factor transporter transmembrane protein EcfT
MHPVAWLAWATCASLAAISTTNPFYLLPLFACACLVYATRKRSGPEQGSFRMFLIFGGLALGLRVALVLFDLEHVSSGTVAFAFLEGGRIAVILSIYGAFSSVSDPFRVLRLAPRRFHEPALAAALALSIAPRTVAAVGRVREAQRMRGMPERRWRSLPALAVPVLETGLEEAVTLAESMDARGHGRGRRSRYRPDRWSLPATITVFISLSSLAAFAAYLIAGSGGLSVSTFPLRWPTASAGLVVAAFAFAVPAFLRDEDSAGAAVDGTIATSESAS